MVTFFLTKGERLEQASGAALAALADTEGTDTELGQQRATESSQTNVNDSERGCCSALWELESIYRLRNDQCL